MLERRSLLTGLAALPAAGLPITALAGPGRADPFAAFQTEMLALLEAVDAAGSEEAAEPHMARWTEIDRTVMHLRPTTLAEAASALDYARREYIQFTLEEDPEGADDGERLVLHVLDGVIDLLRRVGGGGTA